MSMAEMELRETSPGFFLWQWTSSGNRSPGDGLTLLWPAGCAEDVSVVRCGPDGLSGTLEVDGVGELYSAALVKVYWVDGQSSVHTLTSAQPTVRLFGSADDRRGVGDIASAYGRARRRAHSGRLRSPVVRARVVVSRRLQPPTRLDDHCIHVGAQPDAGAERSRLVDAAAAARRGDDRAVDRARGRAKRLSGEQTLARRWPALVAFTFGLVHGLGFAGALKEIGLPQNHLPVRVADVQSSASKLGQLLVVGAAATRVYRLFASGDAIRGSSHAGAVCDRHRRRVLVDRPDRRHPGLIARAANRKTKKPRRHLRTARSRMPERLLR